MQRLLQKAFKADSSDVSYLLWLFIFGAFLGVGTAVFNLTAVVNFLGKYDTSYFPGAFICSGIIGAIAVNTFISIKNWVPYGKVALFTFLVLILLISAICFLTNIYHHEVIGYAAFVLVGPLNIISIQIFRGLVEQYFDIARAKRFTVIASSGLISFQVISLSLIALEVNPSINNRPSTLYLISTIALINALIVLFIICYKFDPLKRLNFNIQYIKAYNGYGRIISQSYVFHLALFSLVSGLVFYLVDFTFLNFVDTNFPSPIATQKFLAIFYSIVIAVAFILEALIYPFLNNKYGLKVTLLIAPFCVFLFTGIYGVIGIFKGYNPDETIFFLIFMIICISKAFSFSLFKALEIPSFNLFFKPLDQILRIDIQSRIEAVVRETGKVLSGIILITSLNFLGIVYYPFLIIGAVLVWGYLSLKINSDYRDKLRQSLNDQEEVVERKDKPLSGVISELESLVKKGNPQQVKIYLSLLKILDPNAFKNSLVKALYSNDDDVQKVALTESSRLCLLPAIPDLENIQSSRFYPILRNRGLFDEVYLQLKGAKFRIKKAKYVEQLTISKIRKERIFGALLAAYMDPEYKPKMLNKLFLDSDEKVRYMAVTSADKSDNTDLHKNLIEKLGESKYGNAAVSSVTSTGENILNSLENAFYLTGQEEKIQLRIVQVLERIGSNEAINMLLKKLTYKNQNVSKAAFEALSTSGINLKGDKALTFKAELEEYIGVLVWNMSSWLDLEGNASGTLLKALEAEVNSNYKMIFNILSLLYEPKTISLIQNNIFSEDPESSEYAIGLLDVVLNEEIKPLLLPVLNKNSYQDKVDNMQGQIPSEQQEKLEVLYDLVQRDYKYVNRWTKACAIKELAENESEIDVEIFLANIVNPDSLLKETSAVALYIRSPELLFNTFQRFKIELGHRFEGKFDGKTDITSRNNPFDVPSLQFEIIKYLNEVDYLEKVPGIVLMEVAKAVKYSLHSEGSNLVVSNDLDEVNYFIVRSGEIQIFKDSACIGSYYENSFISCFNLIGDTFNEVRLTAGADSEIYEIDRDKLNEVMSFHEEIAWSIIRRYDQQTHDKELKREEITF